MDATLMKFKRFEEHSHQLENTRIKANYDRLLCRFRLLTLPDNTQSETEVITDKYLLLSPFHNGRFTLNDVDYQLKIRWFLIWHSSIIKPNSRSQDKAKRDSKNVIIPELLPYKRKTSIMLCIYVFLITSLKIGLSLYAV